jgi:hypothetical protein
MSDPSIDSSEPAAIGIADAGDAQSSGADASAAMAAAVGANFLMGQFSLLPIG